MIENSRNQKREKYRGSNREIHLRRGKKGRLVDEDGFDHTDFGEIHYRKQNHNYIKKYHTIPETIRKLIFK